MRLIRRVLIVLALLATAPGVAAYAQSPAANRVLLLYSHEREMAMFTGFDRAFRARMQSGAALPIEFYAEYLDLIRFAEPLRTQDSIDYFRAKYAGPRIDLIVTIGSLAFDFVREHGDAIFPGIPIVFTSVNASRIAQLTLEENTTGVAVTRDVRQTLDLLLTVQPDVRRIVIPTGSSPTEKAWAKETRELFQPYEKRVQITYLSDLSMETMLQRLSSLGEKSAVLFTTLFYYDADGRYFRPEEALASISARSNAPVYGTDEAFLGLGIVGGVLYDPSAAGDTAARFGQRILAGAKPAEIPVETTNPNYTMFDARQLERWHISRTRLPPGSVIRFEEVGTWERYRVYIVGALSLLILQAALIVGLIVASARRRRAEASLRTSHVQIRDLAGRLITAQEQERTRLARELHDDVGQRMAIIGMELTELDKMLPSGAEAAHAKVRGVDDIVAALARDVRGISHKLHSSKLEYLGLAIAAGGFCKEISSHHRAAIEYVHENVPTDLDETVAISLFRVLQEALSNALKHSGAQHFRVMLQGSDGQITLQVIDDGRGFDVPAALSGQGLGLIGMQERLRLVSGEVVVDSAPGAGTTVRASAPLRASSRQIGRPAFT